MNPVLYFNRMFAIYDHAIAALRRLFDLRIKEAAVLDTAALFPDADHFIAHWRAIRDEALSVARELNTVPRFHEVMREQAPISANDGRDWRMFIMQAYGHIFRASLDRCPVLASVVARSPDVLSASFSFLAAGKHIPPHHGPFRGILRGYLVLDMPRRRTDGSPAAVLKVDQREYRLPEGEFMLWDDTYEHEVWNDSDSVRIVLLLDIRRRGLPVDMRVLSAAVIALVRFGVWLRGRAVTG